MSDDHRAASRKVVFNALDRDAEIDVTHRNLPHWFQADAAIFVTFRTADSLPREVLLWMKRELEHWLMVRKLPIELADSFVDRQAVHHAQLLEALTRRDRQELQKL